MQRALLLTFLLLACSHAPPVAEPNVPAPSEPVLTLPQLEANTIALRMIVAGDGGEPGPVHNAAFGAARALADKVPARALLLMPGDITYPAGLPADCAAAHDRLDRDYLSRLPAVPFLVVPGNHDHGDRDSGTAPGIAARMAWFDCREQPTITSTGWDAKACPCDARWRAPIGVGDVGALQVIQPGLEHPGLTVIGYDSQKALSSPAQVAGTLVDAIEQLPADERVIILAHHPPRTVGTHATGANPQDAGSASYQAYAQAIGDVLRAHADRIVLTVFGHDHNLQYLPGTPPVLISGAASKMSAVTGAAPEGGFAAGDTPGLALIDLQTNGDLHITFVRNGEPWSTTVSARRVTTSGTLRPAMK